MTTHSNISEILDFLRQLGVNNERPWFKQRKQFFDRLNNNWKSDIDRLISLMSQWDDKLCGLTAMQSVYRIYRDTRFSPDKTPYKTHFAAALGKGGRHCVSSAYYIHMQPGNSMLCGGVWWPEKDKLDAIRRLIDAEAEEFKALISNPEITSRYIFDNESLKNVPRGFDKDHPLAEYLKLKSYILVKRVSDDYFDNDDWVAKVNDDFRPLKPLHDFFDYVYDE